MSRKANLSDLQLILLSTAAQRKDGNVLPAADSISGENERIDKAIPPLLRRKLVEEAPVKDRTRAWREEDQQFVGLVITSVGRAMIAADEGRGQIPPSPPSVAAEAAEKKSTSSARPGSKAELVLGLLQRSEGATISELIAATGWLPHTTRAALTGLRKKGHVLEKTKRDDVTCYRIAEAA